MACRNVLVGNGLVAKVADFGMARDISKDGQYIKTTEVSASPLLWPLPILRTGVCAVYCMYLADLQSTEAIYSILILVRGAWAG